MRQRKDVFISYSRRDKKWKNLLDRHLRPLEKVYDCRIWSDAKIEPGAQWQHEIATALASTRVAVLLLSADFLASDFITNNELPPLLQAVKEEGAIILPLIIKPCAFERTRNLCQFQAFNDPAKPLIRLSEGEQEEIFNQLASRIDELLNQADGGRDGHHLSASFDDREARSVSLAGKGQERYASVSSSGFNPKYTFASFVGGQSNELAHAAARRVAEMPSFSFNPFFIYGSVGLGKTHLLHAIGHEIQRSRPKLCVLYLMAQQFANHVNDAIRSDRMSPFHDLYRTIDVLMIDDVQFLANKKRIQEELLYILNTLYTNEKQIILASDASTRKIPALDEGLRSRFESGLVAGIQSPGLETKMAILQRKALSEGVKISEEVAEFIARQAKSNIRELEGFLTRVLAFSSLKGEVPSLALARETLKDFLPEEPKRPNPQEIIELVALRYDLKISEIKSKSNSHQIVFPRQVAMYLCKRLTDLSYSDIGKLFTNKHHSSVMYSVETVQKKRESDPEFDRTLHNLELRFL